jgi:hypothetical protein
MRDLNRVAFERFRYKVTQSIVASNKPFDIPSAIPFEAVVEGVVPNWMATT